ncbi:MAG: pre-mRNA-splicing factor 8, partial [Chaenotheca gracillima]
MRTQVPDPLDSTKKTVSFLCSTAVAPQNIAFAVGVFEHVDLSEFRETDEDDKLGRNAIPIHGFCLPGRANEVKNTCLPMAKAMDFFTLTYGSYPYSSYKLCFVDDLVSEIAEAASFSICSNRLLFPEDIIETLDDVTRQLVHKLATQWIGIDIIPKEPADTWVIVGVAHFMADIFMKRLSGNNEYRYRQKRLADKVCEVDVARPSLYALGTILTIDTSELDLMSLKAPLVLFILDRRLAKASGSSGLSRIISRLLLNAKVGELANGALSTAQFLRTCEKLGHTKLELFFQQWVYGAGCPKFYVTQRFNKKKSVVEMLIKQTQSDQSFEKPLEKETFIRDAKEEMYNVYAGPTQAVFTGPMTIRIHEADGTPY